MSLPWKGNVRELDNVLERAMIMGNGEWITPADLPGQQTVNHDGPMDDNLTEALESYEKIHIEKILEKTDGDKKRAAEILGLSLSTLYRKLERLEISC